MTKKNRKKKNKARRKQILKLQKQKEIINQDIGGHHHVNSQRIRKRQLSKQKDANNEKRVKKFQLRLPKTIWEFIEDLSNSTIKQPFKKLVNIFGCSKSWILNKKEQILRRFKKDQ